MVRRFLYLNGLAVLGAVLYHATAWGYISLFFWTDRYAPVSVPNFEALGGATYFGLRLIEQLIIFSIPCFLFVSGFFAAFAAGRSRATAGYNTILPRIRTLAIPFVVWSCIVLGLDMALGRSMGVVEFITTILSGQAADPYYFVPVLIQLYLLIPLMTPQARNHPWRLLVITGLLQLIVALLRYDMILGLQNAYVDSLLFLVRSWFFPGYIFWFALGMVVGFHGSAIKARLIAIRWGLVVVMAAAFVAGMVEWENLLRLSGKPWIGPRETLVDQVYSLAFLLVFIAFENVRLPLNKPISDLGARSYGIYLVHTLALVYTSKIVNNFAPQLLSLQFLFQPLLVAAGLGIPLAMMWLMNRSPMRRMYGFIFG